MALGPGGHRAAQEACSTLPFCRQVPQPSSSEAAGRPETLHRGGQGAKPQCSVSRCLPSGGSLAGPHSG